MESQTAGPLAAFQGSRDLEIFMMKASTGTTQKQRRDWFGFSPFKCRFTGAVRGSQHAHGEYKMREL